MLSQKVFKEFAQRFRTSELNVMREYLQNLLLSFLYQHPLSDRLAFKGGTALRLLYGSPRFSEDLEFSSGLSVHRIKIVFKETLEWMKKEAISFQCREAKATSGGYFAQVQFELYGQQVTIEWNISLRCPVAPEPILVTTPLIPHYQCMVLPLSQLVHEKIEALLRRKKPRDFFDLYFFLRDRRGIPTIYPFREELIEEVRKLQPNIFKRELKLLLPLSHHSLVKNFPSLLEKELQGAFPTRKISI